MKPLSFRRAFVLSLALSFGPVAAAPALAKPLTLRYQATWAGLPAADVHLQFDEAGRAYHSRIDIRTEGLPKLLSRFRARAESEGALSAGGAALLPSRHDALYDLRSKKDRRTSLRFLSGLTGPIAVRGPADTSKKPPPAEAVRRGVIDPLSALTAIRAEVARGEVRNGGAFAIPVFDGKRRFDVIGRIDPQGRMIWPGTSVRTLPLTLTLQPVAGFDDDPDEKPDDRPRVVSLVLTDDERLIPVEARLTVAGLPATLTLTTICDATTPCRVSFADAPIGGADGKS